ncbi:hypothetical protein Tco_1046112, partial [Tanacetum coccineum]
MNVKTFAEDVLLNHVGDKEFKSIGGIGRRQRKRSRRPIRRIHQGRYGVSVPALTKYHEGNKIQYAVSRKGNMSYSSYMGIKYSGRYQTWSLLQETPNTPYPRPWIRRGTNRITNNVLLASIELVVPLKHFKTLSHDESRSPDFDLFSDQEEYSGEEVAETMVETMEQYISKTRANYGSGVDRPKIEDKDNFELKGQFLKELRTNTFIGLDYKDANEHIKKVLEIVDLFHIPNITIDQVMLRALPMSLTGAV